jgi:hypothetical protein
MAPTLLQVLLYVLTLGKTNLQNNPKHRFRRFNLGQKMYNHKEHCRTLIRESLPGVKLLKTGYYFKDGLVTDIIFIKFEGKLVACIPNLPTTETELVRYIQEWSEDLKDSLAFWKRTDQSRKNRNKEN